MASDVKRIPDGYHTVTPSIAVTSGVAALEFYKRALGAEIVNSMTTPDGSMLAHAEIRIGDSIIFVSDEYPDMDHKSPATLGGSPVSFYLYVEDADASFDKAVAAGATSVRPMQDMFWGDRLGTVADPYGHKWTFSTHVKDMTLEEVEEASKEFFSQTQGAA